MNRDFEMLKIKAANARPYLAAEIHSLHPVLRENWPHLSCDKHFRAYFGEEFFSAHSQAEQIGILLCSVYRLAMNHYGRAKKLKANPILWRLASAFDTNCAIKKDGLTIPNTSVFPSMFKLKSDLHVEAYYVALLDMMDANNQKLEEAVEGLEGEDGEKAQMEGGLDGSCADNEPRSWEEASPGMDESPSGLSEDDIDLMREALGEKIRSRGDVPAGYKLLAKARDHAKVDWKKELHALVRRATELVRGLGDYTYHRLPRRQPPLGCQMAASVGHRVGVAVVIDTSGSMQSEETNQAIAEVGGILKSLPQGSSVRVLSCDSMTHKARQVFRAEDIELAGGGGTDMRVGIADALAVNPKPDVVIVITDGYTPWPAKNPGVEVVACLTQKPSGHLPHWMRFVVVNLES